MVRFEYHEPRELREALELLAQHGAEAKVLAGGVALLVLMKQRLVNPSHLVSISRIEALNQIQRHNGTLEIGALATHAQIERSPLVREHFPLLAEAFHAVANPRIRNMGTLGGNLCHADPRQDPPAALIALGARVKLASTRGEREMALESFFTDYFETALSHNEILTQVSVPPIPAHTGFAHVKFTPRSAQDFATVGMALLLTLDPQGESCHDLRIVLSAVGPTPIRARRAEELLRGKPPTTTLIQEAVEIAASEAQPLSDLRGSEWYKREMVKVLLCRAIPQALERTRTANKLD